MHPNKGRRWLNKKYFRYSNNCQWTFYSSRKDANGLTEYRDLIKARRVNIIRHVKIRAEANPYDPVWNDYFTKRKKIRKSKNQDGRFIEETG